MGRRRRDGAGPTSRLTKKEVLWAARQHYEFDVKKNVIAEKLGVSPSYVGRLLAHAREEGWVHIHVDSHDEIDLGERLAAHFPTLIHTHVVPDDEQKKIPGALASAVSQYLDLQLDLAVSGTSPISAMAIGGSPVHRGAAQRIGSRPLRIDVGPTALTPRRGRMKRETASTVAVALAYKIGALHPGQSIVGERGEMYDVSVQPPMGSLEELRAWYAWFHNSEPWRQMVAFWSRCDVILAGGVPLHMALRSYETPEHNERFGLTSAGIKAAGATMSYVNRYLDADGRDVPLAEGVPSYDPAIPTEILCERVGAGTRVVLSVWGQSAAIAASVIDNGLANVLITDEKSARSMLADG